MFRMPTLTLLSLLVGFSSVHSVFKVIWNVASGPCKWKKVSMNLDRFNITHNEGEAIFGEEVVLFYEKKFGLCPYYNKYDPNQPVNGGLPQNVSLKEHLEKVLQDIKNAIPNRNFSGIAVIDLEEWRPLYNMNWGDKKVYQTQSVKLVKKKHPNITEYEAEKLAELEFNIAARVFFVWTLWLARMLRPKARWGYYDYPFCNADAGDKPDEYSCRNKAKRFNDELDFVYRASSALYPSIYLNGKKSAEKNFRFVQALLNETKRVAEKRTSRLPIYVYTKFEYDPYKNYTWFYSQCDLCNTMKQPADLGMNGLVLWSTSKKIKERCNYISNYMNTSLGPVLVNVRGNLTVCRETKCMNRGECVLKQPAKECNFDFNFDDYECRCDWPYKGRNCSTTYFLVPQ